MNVELNLKVLTKTCRIDKASWYFCAKRRFVKTPAFRQPQNFSPQRNAVAWSKLWSCSHCSHALIPCNEGKTVYTHMQHCLCILHVKKIVTVAREKKPKNPNKTLDLFDLFNFFSKLFETKMYKWNKGAHNILKIRRKNQIIKQAIYVDRARSQHSEYAKKFGTNAETGNFAALSSTNWTVFWCKKTRKIVLLLIKIHII